MQVTLTNENVVALALGSNLGDRLGVLRAAVIELAPFFTVTQRSPIYETPAAYVIDQPAFLNAALLGVTDLSPPELLRRLKQTELALGREPGTRYGPRLIDIDIVFYGTEQSSDEKLTLPHPRLQEREFVLRPLADIAPDWLHPQTALTISTMLEALPQTARRLEETL